MKADVKEKWVKALRSGKYTQADGSLRFESPDGVEHCCLGVLMTIRRCRRLGHGFLKTADLTRYPGDTEITVDHSGGEFIDPDTARRWGLTEDEQIILASMNDRGDNFDEIADWIEANL